MIDRYCFVKLLDGEVAARDAIAAHLRTELAAIAGAGNATVGVPADSTAARWDLSIVVRAADLGAWQRLEPQVAAVLDATLAPRAAVIKSWTFDVL